MLKDFSNSGEAAAAHSNAPLIGIPILKWGRDEILESIQWVMENDISYLEFVFLLQDKIADKALEFSDQKINSIARCLDVLEDIFSNCHDRIAAEIDNAPLIEAIFSRLKRIVSTNELWAEDSHPAKRGG